MDLNHLSLTKRSLIYNMNWMLLIIAGLFEVAFAACLGKAKETNGTEMWFWYAGFLTTIDLLRNSH